MTGLVLLIPSHRRPQAVARMAEAMQQTGAAAVPVVWAVDRTDPTLSQYETEIGMWMPATGRLLATDSANMRTAINLAARDIVTDPGVFAVAIHNDDHLPRTERWHELMVEALREMGTGVVYGDDGIRGARLCTAWMMTADIIRTIGQAVPLLVSHMCADNAVMDLARAAGCLRYLPNVEIAHAHHTRGLAAVDATYRRGQAALQSDRAVYAKWLRSTRRERQIAAVQALAAAGPDHPTQAPSERETTGPMLVVTYARRDEPQSLVDDLRTNLAWVDGFVEVQVDRGGPWGHEGELRARQRKLVLDTYGEGVWVLFMDPDERLADTAEERIRAALAAAGPHDTFGFPLREMWTPTAYRVDGQWGSKKPRRRLFRLAAGQRFVSKPIHSAIVPSSSAGARKVLEEVPLYHLKNIEPQNRIERAKAYLDADPEFKYQRREGRDWSWLHDETGLQLAEIESGYGFFPPYMAGSYLFVAPGGPVSTKEDEAQ